ncbi:MAG TPA: hypothetical protein VJ879_11970, partial [Desulfobacter sp.]|nr:hypothetical protein [Desulfobacter sp.]
FRRQRRLDKVLDEVSTAIHGGGAAVNVKLSRKKHNQKFSTTNAFPCFFLLERLVTLTGSKPRRCLLG